MTDRERRCPGKSMHPEMVALLARAEAAEAMADAASCEWRKAEAMLAAVAKVTRKWREFGGSASRQMAREIEALLTEDC